jgi:hypothetical protein
VDAVKGVNSRYPFDSQTIERKASEALPDWVYRYVSSAAGDGRTQRANIAAHSRYGITPRMMVSPPERDLSIRLFDKHFDTPIFMCPIGLIGLCAPLPGRCGRSTGVGRHRGAVYLVDVLPAPDGGGHQTRRDHAQLLPALSAGRSGAGGEPHPPC